MKYIFLLLTFLIAGEKTIIEKPFSFFETNSMGNVFLVKDYTISQYTYEGKPIQTYSKSEYGNITSVDVSNPFRILLFYKDFNSIVFLDNRLAEISDHISFDALGITEANVVCSSATGGFWLFNTNTYQLEKYNSKLDLLQSGTNMQSIIGRNKQPDFLTETGNYIYLGIKNKGIYLFDFYGTFIKFIPANYKSKVKIINDYIFYSSDSLYRYNTKSFETNAININYTENNSFSIEKNLIFIGDKKTIKVFNNE
jgi:hypothetical protein